MSMEERKSIFVDGMTDGGSILIFYKTDGKRGKRDYYYSRAKRYELSCWNSNSLKTSYPYTQSS